MWMTPHISGTLCFLTEKIEASRSRSFLLFCTTMFHLILTLLNGPIILLAAAHFSCKVCPAKDSLKSFLWFPRRQESPTVAMVTLSIPIPVALVGPIPGFPPPSLRPFFSVCGTPDVEEVDPSSSGY